MSNEADPTQGQTRAAPEAALLRAVFQLADRIEVILDAENAQLAAGTMTDIDAVVARKSHLIVELMRVMKHFEDKQVSDALRDRIRSMAGKLEVNSDLLRRNIAAVQEVSRIIANAIAASGDDGTYSARPGQFGAGRW